MDKQEGCSAKDKQWQEMLRQSFVPYQWYHEDKIGLMEEKLMWVYIKTERGIWTVGYWSPDRQWHPDGDYPTQEEAALRVHWLNGDN